jgi:DNA polymerase III delta prime subunit
MTTIAVNKNDFLFVEKYRPNKISDIILPKDMKKTFNGIVSGGELPNMLLCGGAGVGKTTLAKALCNELGLDNIIINGSMDGGIDVLRNKIKQFASTVSLGGGTKVVILDEADYLSPTTQPALRNFIEEFSNNCRFIFTCNFKNRIIEPLHSRCQVYEFVIPNKEKPAIAGEFFKRLVKICNEEDIVADEKVLAQLVSKHFPDWRRVLNEVQRHAASGSINASALSNNVASEVDQLVAHLKGRDFKAMRKWVADNIDVDPSEIYRQIFDNATTYASDESVPQIILIIAEYQHKGSNCADIEINTVACLTELMASIEWK